MRRLQMEHLFILYEEKLITSRGVLSIILKSYLYSSSSWTLLWESMWELVTRIIWLPFDIMQRVSQRIFHLGRAVYSGLFGPSSKPAIKPPPPKGTFSSSSSILSVVSKKCSPTSSLPLAPPVVTTCSSMQTSCVVIDMEPSALSATKAEHSPDPEAASSNIESTNISSLLLSAETTLSQLSDDTKLQNAHQDDLEPYYGVDVVTSRASIDAAVASNVDTSFRLMEPSHAAASAPAANEAATEVLSEKEAFDPDVHRVQSCSMSRKSKRFRETEKRAQVDEMRNDSANIDADETATSTPEHGSSAKKQKLSVEPEEPSATTSSRETTTPSAATEKVKKGKKKRSKKNKKIQEVLNEKGGKMGVGPSEKPPPPNYFIAIQVSNKDIISNVAQLQKSLSEKTLSPPWHDLSSTEIFKDAMVPVTKLHFTLHVMHLNGEEDVQSAQSALAECCSEVHQEFVENPMDITIEGLGHFKNNVIFAQIKEKSHIERLTRLADLFRKKFQELDIPVDPRPFKPHMTIAKISRSNKLYKKKIRSFPPDIWSGCEETCFGVQRVTGLQLLQMAGEDKTTGYYQCLGQYYFEDPLQIKTTEKLLEKGEHDESTS